MTFLAMRRCLLVACALVASARPALAQVSPPPAPDAGAHATHAAKRQEAPPAHAADAQPNLAIGEGWPAPVMDLVKFSYLLIDLAELQRSKGADTLRWDLFGWHGGDVHRFWFKSEGRVATETGDGEIELQALYGKLITPFFDLQAGVRIDRRMQEGSDAARVHAVVGLQGLAPYRFELEPTLFLSDKGKLSGRVTASYDVLLSQRLILQPRLETNVALQADEEIGVGAGWNDAELGLRLRCEVRREFAPYMGVTWRDSFGATHRLAMQEDGEHAHLFVVAGVRAWF